MKNKPVVMDRGEAISEHKRLVSVLRKGDKKAVMKEALKQAKELKDYKTGR